MYRGFNEHLAGVGVWGCSHWLLAAGLGVGWGLAAEGQRREREEPKVVRAQGTFLFLSGFTQQLSFLRVGGLYSKGLSDSPVATQEWILSLEFVMGKPIPLILVCIIKQDSCREIITKEFPLLSKTPAWFTEWEAQHRWPVSQASSENFPCFILYLKIILK